jgi:hypothetical protein
MQMDEELWLGSLYSILAIICVQIIQFPVCLNDIVTTFTTC